MSLILNGTTGISDVDGTAAAPALTGTDTNTGIFFPAADTIAFAEGGAEAVRINSSGDLLVGTSTTGSAGISLSSAYNIGWGQSAGESVPNIFRQSSSAATVLANGYRYSATSNGFASSFSSSFAKSAIALNEGSVRFYTDTAVTTAAGTDVTPTERARIDTSGNLLVGTTDSPATLLTDGFAGVAISSANWLVASRFNNPAAYFKRENSNGEAVFFLRDATTVGSISVTTTATSFNTSSDYRLKEAIAPMTGALAKVALLKPCTYKWKVDGSDGQGFIAHELDEVVPGCVTGEKDAVDADGNPQYQGIDTSFLVATLTAALQEQQALITALTTRITALEGVA